MSSSLPPHRQEPARLLCSWDSPGKNTGVGCHALLWRIFPTQESNPFLRHLLHCRQILYPLSHLGSPNLYNVACQLYVNKTGKKIFWKRHEAWVSSKKPNRKVLWLGTWDYHHTAPMMGLVQAEKWGCWLAEGKKRTKAYKLRKIEVWDQKEEKRWKEELPIGFPVPMRSNFITRTLILWNFFIVLK